MSSSNVLSIPLPKFSLWEKIKNKRPLISFDLEVTARCNNDCNHCYINLPAGDIGAKDQELSLQEIDELADEAVSLGALWCLITGGEPLLRKDFTEIYLTLKRKGLLVSVFTNANLINEDHIELFKKYPPRDIEVSVYGVTEDTYERVTKKPGTFEAFKRGLELILDNGIPLRLKAMVMRSNLSEFSEIANFCRQYTKDYFRFDPFLHKRLDGDEFRNKGIVSERLSPQEIIFVERNDPDRSSALYNSCEKLIIPDLKSNTSRHLFQCGAGVGNATIGYNGFLRLCTSLNHPNCVYDLRKGNLIDAWHNFVPKVREMQSHRQDYLEKCNVCPLINLCIWCPAHAYLENGELDAPVDYFCKVAHAREQEFSKHNIDEMFI